MITVFSVIFLMSSAVDPNASTTEKIITETAKLIWSMIAEKIRPGKDFNILFKNIDASQLK